MTDLGEPPAERDLPAVVAMRLRTDLLTTISRWSAGPPVRRPRVVAVAVALGVAVGALAIQVTPVPEARQVVAMGPAELSSTLQRAVDQCLEWQDSNRPDVSFARTDLAVATWSGYRAMVLFMTDAGYLTCEVNQRPGAEVTGASAAHRWEGGRDLLPGPVQRLLLVATGPNGGDVAVSGRVSARVHRLLLDHGDGTSTPARLARGAFGILTDGAAVDRRAELVSYDRAGTEIDRRSLFQPVLTAGECDRVPEGSRSPAAVGCRTAEPWGR